MQTTILIITLVTMLGALIQILRAFFVSKDTPEPEKISKTRSNFIWALAGLGVMLSVVTLRQWPHVQAHNDALVVNITSGQWWWDTDTTEIPLGRQVEFRVTSEDVNHGLGIYNDQMRLLIQVQAMPNYTNKVAYTFEEPGTYQILCMEFCGVAHHDMINEFVVLEEGT